MDFFKIKERSKNGLIEIYPDFKIVRSKDLMVRSRSFYAIWDEERGLWSTDEYDVQRLVDSELREYASKITDAPTKVRYMSDWSSKAWSDFRSYMSHLSDNAHQLDENLTFANQQVTKNDYVSKRLPYPIEEGVRDSYEELISTLYAPEERAKIEWAIGAIISGDAKHIQKFLVLYGEAGTGKSTVLNIVQKLFEGYYTTFEAKALTSSNNSFSTEAFSSNPLVAIQHDGDLSKIEDNSKLNSLISHEMMTINQKYKAQYMARVNCFLFMATNKPVKITDSKSGIIRRLIDVRPTGDKVPTNHYNTLMSRIDFELSAIASHCLSVYLQMGKNYYSSYRPIEMMFQTDTFFNFVEAYYHYFVEEDGVSLVQAYTMYKTFCDESLIDHKLPRYKFREELKSYFKKFEDMKRIDGKQVRSYYSKFKADKFKQSSSVLEKATDELVLDKTKSIFDKVCADCLAQYATENEVPKSKWANVKTTLKDIDTTKVHYVKPPENMIVIDFDLKDPEGKKDAELNLRAASEWPPTYAEFSKGGSGVHLHYIYAGEVSSLQTVYGPGIEVKTFTGNSSLRRKLSYCNGLAINTLVSGLAVKEQKSMIDLQVVKSEKGIRSLIEKNLHKEIHPGTKPSIDFILKILDDAYESGLQYDVTDMRPRILAFASNSTNQSELCVKLVSKMKFKSAEEVQETTIEYDSDDLVFFDVEVFPNLFVVVWKVDGKAPVKMINPKGADIEELLHYKLVGFNNRRYDNHILYARYLGFNNQQLFIQSQRLISNSANATFGEAYNLSYTDIYDFSSKKQSLKKWEIELGIHHKELGMDWNEPVPEELWDLVADYCVADVNATEYLFKYLSADWTARQILAELSGLTVNCTTQQHAAKIIFGDDKEPQKKFVYTHLSEMFPGYKFDYGKSTYKGVETGEGGYVYGEPGLYHNVALLDVVSMHPTSIINLNLFGPYTSKFRELVEARVAIKNRQYAKARKMFSGSLSKFLEDETQSQNLAYALKIVINIVYGLTSAKFQNKFKDPRNIDNIVAKRGALFMVDLKEAVQEKGFTVAHIKTDSIKIPNATPEIIEFIKYFGEQYGYEFEHEDTYSKMCLVNDAVYIAKTSDGWKAVGAQFQNPYVYKMLFSKEPIELDDLVEVKAVTSALYLDLNEDLPEGEHNYVFVGRVGAFVPVLPGYGGGILYREKDGKYYAAVGTKGYRWLEVETVKELNIPVDYGHHNKLVEEAKKTISEYGPLDEFIA